jgi:hypothetical protein
MPFTIPRVQQYDLIPTWLLRYRQDTVYDFMSFVRNLNSIIHKSAFYAGAGSDFEVSNWFSCSQWVYSSWDSDGFTPNHPALTDPDYNCIVNQTILPVEDYQGEGRYYRFVNDCVRLFVGFRAIDSTELFNYDRRPYRTHQSILDAIDSTELFYYSPPLDRDVQSTQALGGSDTHFVNFQVYERRNDIPPGKPLRKCILYVCGLESIFLYRLLYIPHPNKSERCKLFLKKRGLGVGFGGGPRNGPDHDVMRRLLTEALSQSKPDYFVNSSAHTDNEDRVAYFDRHLDADFLWDYYDHRETQLFGIRPYDPVDLFLYKKFTGRNTNRNRNRWW